MFLKGAIFAGDIANRTHNHVTTLIGLSTCTKNPEFPLIALET